jgi:hypothetical protein
MQWKSLQEDILNFKDSDRESLLSFYTFHSKHKKDYEKGWTKGGID